MYKLRYRNNHSVGFTSTIIDKPFKVYKPFSHYVLGGSDLTGEHTDCTAKIINDSAEDIMSGCGVNSLCDPRVGFWEMAEHLGSRTAKNVNNSKETKIETPIVGLKKEG